MSVVIQDSNIDIVYQLSLLIPEFSKGYSLAEYKTRLKNVSHKSLLVAYEKDDPVGFKIGYAIAPTVFYSWMGAVLPAKRRLGIAKQLAVAQEDWLRTKGFLTLKMKSRSNHKRMLIFALSNGFVITDVEKRENPLENRIYLTKEL